MLPSKGILHEPDPIGRPSRHILESHGGDTDVLKFYCTTYATTHSAPYGKYLERKARTVPDWDASFKSSGYASNERPYIGYTPALDDLDNPSMKRLLASNYLSMTKKDLVPYGRPDGTEPFPLYKRTENESAFVREPPPAAPSRPFNFIDQRLAVLTAPGDMQPQHVPLLHRLRAEKDPVRADNYLHGPLGAQSEYKSNYGQKPRNTTKQLFPLDIGKKEETGHVVNQPPRDVVTNAPASPFGEDSTSNWTRPTGISMMKSNFRQLTRPDGTEPFVGPVPGAERGSGFHSLKASLPELQHKHMDEAFDHLEQMPEQRADRIRHDDPAEYMNLSNPNNYSSVSKLTYEGRQKPEPSQAERVGNTFIGDQEPSGAVLNTQGVVSGPDDGAAARFRTEYKLRFLDTTAVGLEREGHVRGGTLPPVGDAFERSTGLHEKRLAAQPFVAPRVAATLDSYQSRSLMARDRFFNDGPHAHKMHGVA